MAVEARLTEQMPFVTTRVQAEVIEAVTRSRRISKAKLLRECVDKVFAMNDAELPKGQTIDDVVETGMEALGWS